MKAPAFSAFFEGQIWRIFPDEELQVLVLEIRNYDNRNVSFAAVDLTNKTLLWQKYALQEPWWAGIETVKLGNIFFHGYNHIQYANHLGIISLSIKTQKINWERKDLIFHSIDNDKIIAQRKDQNFSSHFLQINAQNGDLEHEFEGFQSKGSNNLLHTFYPHLYNEAEEPFQKIELFLEKKFNSKPVKAIEYLEYQSFIVLSFYTKAAEKLQNRLILLNNEAEIQLDLILDQQLDGIGTQTFLVCNNQLIFVQNKTELKIYEL